MNARKMAGRWFNFTRKTGGWRCQQLINKLIMIKPLFLALGLWCFSSLSAQSITSTDQFLTALHQKYKGRMPKTISFTQETTFFKADTISGKQTWYEYSEFPDNFRIVFGEPANRNTVIYARDTVYNIKAGKLSSKRYGRNNLMLTSGGWVYLSKEEVLNRLTEDGYKTDKFHEDTWNGRKVYVIGADKGDTTSKQVWVDKEYFYAVRVFETFPNGVAFEGHLSRQIKIGDAWIETHCEFFTKGKIFQMEDYREVKWNIPFEKDLFDPLANITTQNP